MSRTSHRIALRRGEAVFRPGQDCPGFVLLESGSIRVSMTAPNGRELVLYRVNPGGICLQTFACLIEGRRYSAEGIAETDLEGTLIPPEHFHVRLNGDAAFRAQVFHAIARRFADYEQLVEDIALTGFDARLARALLRLRDAAGEVHATHEQLAAETASGRAFVSRRIAELARQGLVEPGRGLLRLLDIGRLEQLAADER